jgi:hypothetical protein
MSLWYIQRKTCTYLALSLPLSPNGPTITLSLNGPKWVSTSPSSFIVCVQNDFRACGTFGANRAPILHQPNIVSKWTETSFLLSLIPKEYHCVRPNWFLSLRYVWRKPWTYLAQTPTLSPIGLKWTSTWASPPRSTMGCFQNDLWAYGMFGANCAPIWLRQ